MAANTGLIMEKSMAIGAEWGKEELQEIIQKYIK